MLWSVGEDTHTSSMQTLCHLVRESWVSSGFGIQGGSRIQSLWMPGFLWFNYIPRRLNYKRQHFSILCIKIMLYFRSLCLWLEYLKAVVCIQTWLHCRMCVPKYFISLPESCAKFLSWLRNVNKVPSVAFRVWILILWSCLLLWSHLFSCMDDNDVVHTWTHGSFTSCYQHMP